MPHKSHEELEMELGIAKTHVRVGGIYSHYKNPSRLYKVTAIGIQEATDKLCVIYQDATNEKLIFVRDLDLWLEEPTKGMPRFRLVKQG
jgi:hypothetical protein